MQTTSSPTSNKRSHARRATALALWFALAALLVLAAFYGQSTEEGSDDEALYNPYLAVNGLVLYGLMIGLTIAIATSFPARTERSVFAVSACGGSGPASASSSQHSWWRASWSPSCTAAGSRASPGPMAA